MTTDSEEQGHIHCTYCNSALYPLNKLFLTHDDFQLIVDPKISNLKSTTVYKREIEDKDENAYSVKKMFCKFCGEKIGICQRDSYAEYEIDVLNAKHTYILLPDNNTKIDVSKWSEMHLKDTRIPLLKLKDLAQRAGGHCFSREGLKTHKTIYVDIEKMEDSQLLKLTQTEMRNYQLEMLQLALMQNTLICLPTGSGKTLISVGVLHAMLYCNPNKVAAFVVQTNPLVEQQCSAIKNELPNMSVIPLSGQMDPDIKRRNIRIIAKYEFDILVCTTESLNKLIEYTTLRIEDLCILIVDEAHHTRKATSNANLMRKIYEDSDIDDEYKPLILGMTASPIDRIQKDLCESTIKIKIEELSSRLKCYPIYPVKHDPYENGIVQTKDFAYCSPDEGDEKQLTQDIDIYLRQLIKSVHSLFIYICPKKYQALEACLENKNINLDTNQFRGILRDIEKELDTWRNTDDSKKEKFVYQGYAIRDHFNQILAALEINEVIGKAVAMDRLKKVFEDIESPSPGIETIKRDLLYTFGNGKAIYDALYKKAKKESKSEHYAVSHLSANCRKLVEVIENHIKDKGVDARMLVFVGMRRTARKLHNCLMHIRPIMQNLNPQVIVGQGLRGDGLNVEEQQRILNDFKLGKTRLLISTTILEEGLDVPTCNYVIRLSAPDSLTQFIQSRGRACRASDGQFLIICKNKKEVELQKSFAKCVNLITSVLKQNAENTQNSIKPAKNEKMTFNLDEDSGRQENNQITKEIKLDYDDGDSDEDYNDLLEIINALDNNAEEDEEDLRFLEEDEPEDIGLEVKLAVWNLQGQQFADLLPAIRYKLTLCPDIKINHWKDYHLPDCTSILGTSFFPEVKLTRKGEKKFIDEQCLFEKLVLEPVMSSQYGENPGFWLQILKIPRPVARGKSVRIDVKDLTIGSWLDPHNYIEHYKCGNTIRLQLEHSYGIIKVIVEEYHMMDFFFHDLEYFIVISQIESEDVSTNAAMTNNNAMDINDTSTPLVNLYMTLKNPPKLSKRVNDETIKNYDHIRLPYLIRPEDKKYFANCYTYRFTIPNIRSMAKKQTFSPNLKQIINIMETNGKTVYYGYINDTMLEEPLIEINEEMGLDPSMCRFYNSINVTYAWRCLLSCTGFVIDRITPEFFEYLNTLPEKIAELALYKLTDTIQKVLFIDPLQCLKACVASDELDDKAEIISELKSHAYVKRITLTPTRIIFYEPDLMQTNRILRKYSNENFMRVNIRDENSDKLTSIYGDLKHLVDRLRDIFQNGMFMKPFVYKYLASSNSQLRNHSCYFIQDDGTCKPDRIRSEIGNLSEIRNVAKFVSRMGQGFSTSHETIVIDNYWVENDIEHDGYVFSDGVGTISTDLAKNVSHRLKLIHTPSAFQIRIGGVKGVVSVDPKFRNKYEDFHLVVRNSMFKYESNYRTLEILEHSRPLPLHLNQQIIMLLSNSGVADDTFMTLLRSKMIDLAEMFTNESTARREIKNIVWDQIKTLIAVDFYFTSEPFLRSMLIAFYRLKMKDIMERSRVMLDHNKGRVLIGILDETGILKYGQVFIQVSTNLDNPSAEKMIVNKKVVILKNPCLHPGDVRTFDAVDHEELRHLCDCVVFPQHGSRPHPNELSGSDLDGDVYHCIWHTDLIPPLPNKTAMDYKPAEESLHDGEITVNEMIEHMCSSIQHDCLGQIDNTHLALTDQLGLEHEACLDLARIHAIVVDAPKTGKWQDVPRKYREMLTMYPDFMMKYDKPSYPSSKILGEMFRESSKYNALCNFHNLDMTSSLQLEKGFYIDGYQIFTESAEETFKDYCKELSSIMSMYGIDTESELLSTCLIYVHNKLNYEFEDVKEIVIQLRRAVISKYENIFKGDPMLGSGNREELEMQKASAWYYVTYHKGMTYYVNDKKIRFLSFPWIAADILAKLYQKNTPNLSLKPNTLYSSIANSVIKMTQGLTKNLWECYQQHAKLRDLIGRQISRIASVHLYGPSSIYIFDESVENAAILVKKHNRMRFSEHNKLHLTATEQKNILKKVENEIYEICDNISFQREKYLKITVSADLPKRKANITADITVICKWLVLKEYIFAENWLLPVFRMLASWGRVTSLTSGKNPIMPKIFMPYLFINFCIIRGVIRHIDFIGVFNKYKDFVYKHSDVELLYGGIEDWSTVFNTVEKQNLTPEFSDWLGHILLDFFTKKTDVFSIRIEPNIKETLHIKSWYDMVKEQKIEIIRTEMDRAFHRLSLHVDASVLLTRAPVEKIFFIKIDFAQNVAGSEARLETDLQYTTGAKVDISPKMDSKEPGMIVKGKGTEAELFFLKKKIEYYNKRFETEREATTSTLAIKGYKDVSGCHSLLVEGTLSDNDDNIVLENYFGMRHPCHDYKSAYILRYKGIPSNEPSNSLGSLYNRYHEHFKRQLAYFHRYYNKTYYGEPKAQIKFGNCYILNPPNSYVEDPHGLTVSDILKALERRKKREVNPMWDETYNGSRGISNRDGRYKSKNNHNRQEGYISTSFASSSTLSPVIKDRVDDWLKNYIRREPEFGVKVGYNTGNQNFTAIYDKDLQFKHVEIPPIRWVVSDVRRTKGELVNKTDYNNSNECDIRFMFKTQIINDENIESSPQASGMIGLLVRDLEKKEKNIKVKETDVDIEYIEENTKFVFDHKEKNGPELYKKFLIAIINKTLYSRKIGMNRVQFGKIEEYHEIRILPPVELLMNESDVDMCLEHMWKMGFEMSDLLSE